MASKGAQQQVWEDAQLPPTSGDVEEEQGRVQRALATVFSVQQTTNYHGQEWWRNRQLADRYLNLFQGTSVAWMVCDRLLHHPAVNTTDAGTQQQRRFFAAQTLLTKCRSDVHELPSESLPSLRSSLLNHLTNYIASGDEALTTRLAMCVSALAIQIGWVTIVDDLLAQCQQKQLPTQGDSGNAIMVAMIVLRSLPEECASDRLLLLDDSRRFAMRDHLVSSATHVFSFLMATMQIRAGQESHVVRVLKVFHIWIRFVPVRPDSLVESPLLPASIQAMTSPEYFEFSADVLVEVLLMYPSHHHGNERLVQMMMPALSQLPLDQALASDDEDVLRAYCRVVTEMGESYMSLILYSHPGQQLIDTSQLIEWILRCSAILDADIAGITLNFWYRMVLDLESVEPFDRRQDLIDRYSSQLIKLIEVCVKNLMRFPSDISDIADDIVEDLEKHRIYVAETIDDCCRLLGGDSVLKKLDQVLREEVHKAAAQEHSEWQGLESCFACIAAVHRFVPSDEMTALPFCFNLISQLPAETRPLRLTACHLIGKYASWLAVHPELLQPLLPYLAHSLSVAQCASAAAIAIKELCGCSNRNFAIAEPVLQLYEELASQPGRLTLNDELQILEGVCRALSRTVQDSRDDGTRFLARLSQPIVHRLAIAVADQSSSPKRLIPEIDRLTVVVRFLLVPFQPPKIHPIAELMRSSWDILSRAVDRFSRDTVLAENVCRLHKHALRTCGANAYEPMLDMLIKQLVHGFQGSRQSPFLYAASICITEYSQSNKYSTVLYEMVAAMATVVFSFLRTIDEFIEHPDVVEEFFYLVGRMVSYCPEPLVNSPLLHSVLQYAVVGMKLDHYGASKGISKFLEATVSYGLTLRELNNPASKAALEYALSVEGQAIVANLALSMMGDLPAYSPQIPEIVWKLNLLSPGLLTQWLQSAFKSTEYASDRAKADLFSALDTGLARDEFSLAVRAFQNSCAKERRQKKMQRRL